MNSFTAVEKKAGIQIVKAAVASLQEVKIEVVDSVALIINDHEGDDRYTTEIWINEVGVVEAAVKAGASRRQARWLYEHWLPEAAKGEVLSEAESPTHDRGRYYSLAVEAVHEIRKQVPGTKGMVFLIDNNHDYDSLVIDAIAAANPQGQAAEWLASPPPDC